MYKRLLSFFIARAIYDGAVTYRYIIDAEVSDVSRRSILQIS